MKAWISFLTRHKDFAAAELALVHESYLVINDAAQLAFELYRDWGKLDAFSSELRKFYFPSGVEKEARFLAIGRIESKHWTAICTMRGEVIRIISVRRARKEEVGYCEGN